MAATAFADGISFQASVDKNTIALDDEVQLSITLGGEDINNAPQPSVPGFDNLVPVSQSQSTNISFINGRGSASVSYIFVLKPQKEGSASIGSSNINVGGKIYQTQPIKINVIPASGNTNSPSSSRGARSVAPSSVWDEFDDFFTRPLSLNFRREPVSEPILAKTTVSQRSAYVNQMLVLTFTFYRRVNLYQPPTYVPPQTTGFWAVNLPVNSNLREVEVKGVHYLAQDFKTVLFPSLPGKMTIGPAALTAQVDPFSSPITIKTDPIIVNVVSLPEEGKPFGYSGAVGRYSMTTALERVKIEKGKPFSLKVKIVGEGNLDTVSLPSLEVGAGLHELSVSSKVQMMKGYNTLSGSKTFEIILMPVKEGGWNAGSVRFSYFDPQKNKYVEIASERYMVNVLPSNIPLPKEMEEDLRKTEEKVVKINIDWKRFLHRAARIVLHPYFQSIFWCIVAAGLAWVVFSKYNTYQLSDPIKLRRKKAKKLARQRLKKSKSLLRAGQFKEFITEIYASATGYLGDKYNFSALGKTEGQIQEILGDKGLSENIQKKLEQFMYECDLARFTPSAVDRKKADELFSNAESLIILIESDLAD